MPKPRAEPEIEAIYDELTAAMLARPGVTLGRILHREALTVGAKVFAFLTRNRLVVKVPEARVAELIAAGTASHLAMPGRVMREWIEVPPAAEPAATRRTWRALMKEAADYVTSLPKARKPARPPAQRRR
jgi:hypothetical protein